MFNKLVRIGKDAELRHLPNGTAVMNFPVAYDIGYGDKKKTQWLDCAMFGDRTEKLVQHINKGKQLVIYADDVCIDTWQKDDGTDGYKLKCKLVSLDFVYQGQDDSKPQLSQEKATAAPADNFNVDEGDDLPF